MIPASDNNIASFDDKNWFNAEDNSDFDTSNESYMSSSDDEEEEDLPDFAQNVNERLSFGGSSAAMRNPMAVKNLTREDKALLQRRFEPFFQRIRMDASEYFHPNNRRPYDRKGWIKLQFDGQIKRCYRAPANLTELLELARSRFGVLECILETG